MPHYIHCIPTRISSYFHSMPHINYCITCITSSTSHTQANTGPLTAPKCGHEWEAHGDVRRYPPARAINGQGRWRLHAQEPGDMVYKYWQSSLLEKIATSNF